MKDKELLKRIDERNYLTEREHRQFLNLLEKDLEILEILKSKIMVIENKQMTFGYGKYYLAIRPDVILSDDTIKIIKEWLDGKD